ncbi:Uncharacterized protein Rs2_46745 [Raphanus sativus]|nr:Uncharacterized protein Rs2_46745 [Raphanus sativus]
MGEENNIMKQLAIMMEKIDGMGSELKSLRITVEGNTAILETRHSSPKAQDDKKKWVLQDHGSKIKISTEELSEVEILSRSKGGKAFPLQAIEAGISTGGRGQPGFSSAPWPTRAVGREQGNQRADGGSDWRVKPIGMVQNEDQYNYPYGGFQRQEENYREPCETYLSGPSVRPMAKIEFPPYDGTKNAVEWL